MDMGSMLQQALQGGQGAQGGQQPTTTETMEPVQGEFMGGPGEGMPQEFGPEEVAEQLAAVESMMEATEDPAELQQLQAVADQLRMVWEDLTASTPAQVEGTPGPREVAGGFGAMMGAGLPGEVL